ncbi:MAG: hypothetical protein WBG48_17695 [Pricia sp.]
MKTALIVFLIPFLALSQPKGVVQDVFFELEVSMEMFTNSLAVDNLQAVEGALEILVTVDILIEDYGRENNTRSTSIPKYLTLLHLDNVLRYTDPYLLGMGNIKNLFASNDLANPTERTFRSWLSPVPKTGFQPNAEQIDMQGFGPRITF